MAGKSKLVKVIYIISDIEKALSFEWIVSKIDRSRFDLRFILIGKQDTSIFRFLQNENVPSYSIQITSLSSSIIGFFEIVKILYHEKPQIVHSHLLKASLIGLSAAYLLNIPSRIYTRHHSALHHYYHKKGIWYDKLINYLSTDIIALCQNSKEILSKWEDVSDRKIRLLPHGFDIDSFENVPQSRVQSLKERYSLADRSPVVGVIARFTEWKGIQHVIPAFRDLLKNYPGSCLVLANAYGDYAKAIDSQLDKNLPKNSFIKIHFEEDLQALYQLFDLYVHVPIDPYVEAFGQTYIESLAAGVPSIFTLSGIACDFVENDFNALVVDYQNSDEITRAMHRILTEKSLKEKLVINGRKSIRDKYDLDLMIKSLERLYSNT